jgi:hypothetical protein
VSSAKVTAAELVAFAPGLAARVYAGVSPTQAAARFAQAEPQAREVFVEHKKGAALSVASCDGSGRLSMRERGAAGQACQVSPDTVAYELISSWWLAASRDWEPVWGRTRTPELRLCVTGGRDFTDAASVSLALNQAVSAGFRALGYPEDWRVRLAHGACRGVDDAADWWAKALEVERKPYPVTAEEWSSLGPKAGQLRNDHMLADFRPHLLIAMPGGPGTAGCVGFARARGIPVWRPLGARVCAPKRARKGAELVG